MVESDEDVCGYQSRLRSTGVDPGIDREQWVKYELCIVEDRLRSVSVLEISGPLSV